MTANTEGKCDVNDTPIPSAAGPSGTPTEGAAPPTPTPNPAPGTLEVGQVLAANHLWVAAKLTTPQGQLLVFMEPNEQLVVLADELKKMALAGQVVLGKPNMNGTGFLRP